MDVNPNSGVRGSRVSRSVTALLIVSAAALAGASAASAAVTRTPQSIECSKQADAKGLHGKQREAFRSECKRQAKTSQTAPLPAPVKAPANGTY